MKKTVIALLLALMLLLPMTAQAEDGNVKTFSPTLLNAMDRSASEWASTSLDRATFSLLAYLDLPSDVQSSIQISELFITYSSYVARSDSNLVFVGYSNDKIVIIGYTPALNIGYYMFTDNDTGLNTPSLIETVIEETLKSSDLASDGYFKNSTSDIQTVVDTLSDALNND